MHFDCDISAPHVVDIEAKTLKTHGIAMVVHYSQCLSQHVRCEKSHLILFVFNIFPPHSYSLYAFLGMAAVIIRNWKASALNSWTLLTCDAKHTLWAGTDWWWYTFYLSKCVEWIDTIILILRGKNVMPPSNSQYFLHVFHHTTVLSISWLSWHYPIGASWSGPITNLFVHTFMYAYYAGTEVGLPRKYGLFITPMQITQFYFCLALAVKDCVFALLYGPSACGLNVYTLAYNMICYGVFLVFFVRMYTSKKETLSSKTPKKQE